MKKLLLFACLILFFFAYGQTNTEQAVVNQTSTKKRDVERILSYNVDVVVHTNSSLTVTETIVVNALGYNIDRGIFRTFPIKRNLNNQTYPLKYKILSVKRDGKKEDYHKKKEEYWLKLYIGKRDVLLSPGVYTYEIKYEVPKQIGFFDTYDELYWNVTGTDWIFSIDEVKATVHLPPGADIVQDACYTGVFGSTESYCQSISVDPNTIVWEANNLRANEGLTVAVGFKKGVIMPPAPPGFLEKYGISVLMVVIFCCFAYYCYGIWKKYGVDPEKPTVYPIFSPPNNLSPASLGYLHYEKFRDKSMVAALTHLAVKKFISIDEVERKKLFGLSKTTYYRISKLKHPSRLLAEEEKILMNKLFGTKSEIVIDGQYTSAVGNASLYFRKSVITQFGDLLNEGRNKKHLVKPALLYFATFIISYIFASFIEGDGIGLNFVFFILFGIVIPVGIIYVLKYIVKINDDFVGCLKMFLGIPILFAAVVFILNVIFSGFKTADHVGITSTLIFLVLGIIGYIFMLYLMKKPSEEKLKIQAKIEGFKMYMSAAENEQIKFHNAPEFTPQLFEAYLPYAMIFEVDRIWGKRFEDLLTRSSLEYTPTWYTGSSYDPILFGSVLGSQLTSLVNSSSTPPSTSRSGGSSSSSSGSYGGGSSSSGSSGSGSSGGGGGGGGGGGW